MSIAYLKRKHGNRVIGMCALSALFACLLLIVPGSVSAAITYVGGEVGSASGSGSNTTVTFSLTGGSDSTPQAGDLVIIAFSNGDTANKTLTVTDSSAVSYTLAGGADMYQNGTSFDSNFIVGYKFMPATPDSAALVGGGDTSGGRAWSVHVFRGVDSSTPLDVAAVTAGNTGTHLVDPGAITPTTSGAIIYVAGAGATNTGANFTAAYLTDLRTANGADTQDGTVGSGYVTWVSGTYNPAAFGGGGTDSTGDSWNAVTLALRPASGGGGGGATVTTDSADVFLPTAARAFGSVTSGSATTCGFAWGTVSTLSSGDTATTTASCPASTGSFNNVLSSSLTANTTYYYRAYGDSTFGSIKSFVTGNSAPSRKMRLFEGFKIKVISDTVKLLQQ